MIVCPVCEHPQAQGETCEVCGKELAVAWGAEEVVPARLADLESTALSSGVSIPASAPMADLELTRVRGGPDLPPEPVPQLESTRSPPVPAVPAAPVPDLDTGRAEADGQKTAAPVGQVACRYCRHVQAAGLFCDACGMRLPKVSAPRAAEAGGVDDELWGVCTSCGTRAMVGRRCGSCGTVMQQPEA